MVKLKTKGLVFFIVATAVILVINDSHPERFEFKHLVVTLIIAILGGFLFKFIFDKGTAWMYKKYGTNKS